MVVCSPPQPMWDITIHPSSGPSVLAGTLSFLQSMWDRPQIHPPSGPSVLTSTLPRVYPHRETTIRLTHRLMSDSDTICNDPDPPLAAQGFKKRLLEEIFHTFINCGLFSSPTNVRQGVYTSYKKCFVFQMRYKTLGNTLHIKINNLRFRDIIKSH